MESLFSLSAVMATASDSTLVLSPAVAQAVFGVTEGAGDLKVWAYVGFLTLIVFFLALDLGVFHRDAHEVTIKEAAGWSVVWVTCAMAFTAFVYFAYDHHWLSLGLDTPKYSTPEAMNAGASLIERGVVSGSDAAQQYLVGYVVELSLAMDNLFVIALIFGAFAIPAKYQHRVLFWGIMGALIMRGGMILVGGQVIMRYQWILIFFGLFLVLTSLKMMLVKHHSDPGKNPIVRLMRKFYPVTNFFDGQKFFTKRTIAPTYSLDPTTGQQVQDPPPPGTLSARWSLTPLFLALILVEFVDLVFAVDSIPAIFAITPDPFIVLTSNIFAIVGLRSLYFCLAALITKFRFLKPALIFILAFVGVKLLLMSVPPYLGNLGSWVGLTWQPAKPIKIDTTLSLMVVVGTLALGVVASLLVPAKRPPSA
jgi:tellurite resistance protein TerC